MRDFCPQVHVKGSALAQLLAAFHIRPGPLGDIWSNRWLDGEGASVIGTLRKAMGRDGERSTYPHACSLMFRFFVRAQMHEGEDPAPAESFALAVAHLLPALIKYRHPPSRPNHHQCPPACPPARPGVYRP